MPRKLASLLIGLACVGLTIAAATVSGMLCASPMQRPPLPEVEAKPGEFIVAPYLQFVTRDAIVIMCETTAPTDCVIEFGTEPPYPQRARSAKRETLHEIRLANLQPGTPHFYKVICTDAEGVKTESKLLSFFTAPEADQSWSFALIGDTQRNPAITAQVAANIWKRRPNFVVHLGDVVDSGPDKREWVHDLFAPCRELFGRVAVFPCIGNHEKNHEHYYKYFSLPKPEYYYSFTYANAEFFSIDTNKKVNPGSEQYEWLDNALARSRAAWKICFHHHPAYTSDNDDYGDSFKTAKVPYGDQNARQLAALYEKHNVDFCFNGHIHVYERTWPIRDGKVNKASGVRYITSGGGGGRLEDFSPTPAFFKAEFRSDFHYCYFTVHGGNLYFKAFDKDDRLVDQFTFDKEPQR